MIPIPSDFDIEMISDAELDQILDDTSLRLKGVTAKSIINLIDEAGHYLMFKDYRVIIKLQPHESEFLLKDK